MLVNKTPNNPYLLKSLILTVAASDSKNVQEGLFADESVSNALKQSFDFWHRNYVDSLINYSLVWKKALDSNADILKRMDKLTKTTKNNSEALLYDFFDLWSHAIRESSFEIAKKSLLDSDEFWKNSTEEQFRIYADILQMIEKILVRYPKQEHRVTKE